MPHRLLFAALALLASPSPSPARAHHLPPARAQVAAPGPGAELGDASLREQRERVEALGVLDLALRAELGRRLDDAIVRNLRVDG